MTAMDRTLLLTTGGNWPAGAGQEGLEFTRKLPVDMNTDM
jgi:hypothetical protein